jgi:nucleoside-diphosphate-sugar epimerase
VKVFVAGATGVLGRPTVRALVAAGHKVTGTARGQEKAEMLRQLGARAEPAELFNPLAMANAISGSDVVINLATKIPPLTRMRSRSAWQANDRLRRDASFVLAEAAKKEQVRLYVQESITFMYADGGQQWLTEDSPLDVSWLSLQSMMSAETVTRDFAESGRRGINLRFGAFYAPYAQSTLDTAKLARRRMFPVAGGGKNFFSSIHVDDAAAAVVSALELPSGDYNVVDDEPLTSREYALAVAKAIRAPRPWRMPKFLFRLVAGGGPASYILRSQRVSNKRFREGTGWAPQYRSAREGWQQVAEEMGARKRKA